MSFILGLKYRIRFLTETKKKNECCFLSLRSSQQFLLPGKALRTNKKITIEQQKPTTKASKEKKEWQFISGPFLQIL